MIVLNEHAWAKEMLSARNMGDKPYETMTRIARYYIDEGYSKSETRRLMDTFARSCDPFISLPKWSDILDSALKKALRFKAVEIRHIDITAPELEKIISLKSIMAKRLAFTLLVLSKYWQLARGSNYWVNNEDSEIMKLANIKTSIKKQCDLYRQLHDAGLIEFSKKVDNTNVQVLFAEGGEVVMEINDLRNLGYQYLAYVNPNGFYWCQNCGVICKRQKQQRRDPKYCPECAVKIRTRQNVNSVMRTREKIKSLQSS